MFPPSENRALSFLPLALSLASHILPYISVFTPPYTSRIFHLLSSRVSYFAWPRSPALIRPFKTCYITWDWYFLTRAIISSHAVLPKPPFAVLREKYLRRSPCWKITSLLWELFSHHLQLKPVLASSKQFLFFPSSNSFLPERLNHIRLSQSKQRLVLCWCAVNEMHHLHLLDTMSHRMDSGAGYTNLPAQ